MQIGVVAASLINEFGPLVCLGNGNRLSKNRLGTVICIVHGRMRCTSASKNTMRNPRPRVLTSLVRICTPGYC
jgi:hypothetical protein